jgi:type I restriction enzyme S subunit
MSELVTENIELPKGWVTTNIESVCSDPQYGWTTSANDVGNVKFLRTTDITSGKINWALVPYCKTNPSDLAKYLLKDGDVVISRAGSIGYSFLITSPPKCIFASYLIRFKPLINHKFFSYFLQSNQYWQSISEKKIGIAVANVNATKLKQIILPLSPLNEQKRIVAKIEELFSKLDHTQNLLELIRLKISQYRYSLFTKSFKNIKHAEILSECAEIGTGGTPSRGNSEYYDGNIPWVKTAEVKNTYIRDTEEKISKLGLENSNAKIYPINSVVLAMYGEGKTRGRVAILEIPASTNQACAVMQCDPKKLFYKYCFYWLQSQYSEIRAKSSGGNQPNLNLRIVKNLEIPLPDLIIQKKIIDQLESGLTQVEFLLRITTDLTYQLMLIKNSIVKQAFEGKLVPQDPNDESAEVLLQKIKLEKQKITSQNIKPRRKNDK